MIRGGWIEKTESVRRKSTNERGSLVLLNTGSLMHQTILPPPPPPPLPIHSVQTLEIRGVPLPAPHLLVSETHAETSTRTMSLLAPTLRETATLHVRRRRLKHLRYLPLAHSPTNRPPLLVLLPTSGEHRRRQRLPRYLRRRPILSLCRSLSRPDPETSHTFNLLPLQRPKGFLPRQKTPLWSSPKRMSIHCGCTEPDKVNRSPLFPPNCRLTFCLPLPVPHHNSPTA